MRVGSGEGVPGTTERGSQLRAKSLVIGFLAAGAFVLAACGDDDGGEEGEVARVVGTEYAFDMPDEVEGGVLTMDFVTEGQEPHEFALGRFQPGKTLDDLVEVLDRGQEPPSWVEDISGVPAMTPGEQISITRELQPGTYVFVCFIPAPNGEPHFDLGMRRQFTVAGDTGESLPEADGVITAGEDGFEVPPIDSGEQTLELRNDASKPREFELLTFKPGKGPGDAQRWFESGFRGEAPVRLLGAMQSIPPDTSVFVTADFESGATYFVADEENRLRAKFTVG